MFPPGAQTATRPSSNRSGVCTITNDRRFARVALRAKPQDWSAMITSTFSCVSSTASASLRLALPPCHDVRDNVPAFDCNCVRRRRWINSSDEPPPAVNTPILLHLGRLRLSTADETASRPRMALAASL